MKSLEVGQKTSVFNLGFSSKLLRLHFNIKLLFQNPLRSQGGLAPCLAKYPPKEGLAAGYIYIKDEFPY